MKFFPGTCNVLFPAGEGVGGGGGGSLYEDPGLSVPGI